MNYYISRDKYPFLFNIKKSYRNEIIDKIFDFGYNYYFKLNNDNLSMDDEFKIKLTKLEDTMSRLIGISNSSMKKGEFAEKILEKYIDEKYSDIQYIDKAQVDHSGDAWLKFNDNEYIMLESKNYTTKVNNDEIEKMKKDMVTNNIKWGIFISWNTSIIGHKDFDIYTFNNNNTLYTIVMISNVINNMEIIDISIMLLRKMITNFSDNHNYKLITNTICNDLDELNKIINMNYLLRDNFNDMEKNIKLSMDKYYNSLREYQSMIEKKIDTIVSNIKNYTIYETTIDFNYNDFLDNYKNNKKIYNILSKIIDVFISKNITINGIDIFCGNNIIGNIKITGKKITIYCNKYNASCDFNIDCDNYSSFEFLNLL